MDLGESITLVENKIEQICNDLIELSPIDLRKLLLHFKEFTLRPGKRIRPLLLLTSYIGYGGKNYEDALTLAAVLEIMHSFLLVHDDIIDNSEFRRGKPTLHKIYEKMYNSEKLGKDLAIVVGDIVGFQMIGILSQLDTDETTLRRLVKSFSECYVNTGFGQLLDVLVTGRIDRTYIQGDIPEYISELKTAYYTLVYPILLGYYLSGKYDEEEISNIFHVGKNAGIAFQYRDDIIGIFGGDAKSLNDLHEGKLTSIVKLTYESLNERHKEQFLHVISKSEKTPEDIEYLKLMIKQTNAVDKLLNKINRLLDESVSYIEKLKITKESKDTLLRLINKIREVPNCN
ncbi:MAG: polyprenyl synthetase family protein [Fervidobacterium sp.]